MADSPQNCPNVLNFGSCSDPACDFVHNIITCDLCALVFTAEEDYQLHLATKKHINRASGASAQLRCPVCHIHASGQRSWLQHVGSRKHINKAARQGLSPDVEPIAPISHGSQIFCELCNINVPRRYWEKHLQGYIHTSRETFSKYKTAVEEAESDKNDVTI